MSPQIIGYFSEKQDFARLGLIVGDAYARWPRCAWLAGLLDCRVGLC